MSKAQSEDYIIDIDQAFQVYQDLMKEEKGVSKHQFLKLIGMNAQSASNYQMAIGNQKIFRCIFTIRELTGMTLNEIIKPLKQ